MNMYELDKNLEKLAPEYQSYNIITNSDAHYLWDISEKEHFFETENKITKNIFESLCKLT